MPREIAGKIFYSADEDAPGPPRPSAEEIADAKAQFAAFNAQRKPDSQTPPPEPKTEENRRFWDDLSGTEYENWTYPGDDRPPYPKQ
jgi:hypothetical protein